ncbi:heavy metal translocating P-type ATPase [Mangrovihabitans endophyticus]|uniref:Cation-transporting P-type ATPase B n=1 Tax=Mangrovihabitans endophyticus TaxID=1751298 RepID=A0A8J3FPI7_9ACTN|nr:heavy metal translocating P-type ATPase [Mangrovihabitans endophyticus]GGK99776.1 carbonate dehydratase [Mangrovihabitans endophyticus]
MTTTASAPAPADLGEIELAVSGMTCAACASRVERQLGKLDGVHATVNLATERATVHLSAPVPLESLVAQVEKAGYGAAPVVAEQDRPDHADRVRDLWRRLMVALLLGIPVADLSITVVLVPALRFPGWQWVLLAMTLPVVTWCAWPFHRKAVAAARHGSSSMDTLVSLGVVTSAGWSFYTVFHDDADGLADAGWHLIFEPAGSVYLDVAVGVTVFVLAGRLFEARARRAAGDALRALARVGAKQATRLRADGTEEAVPADAVRVGDRLVVRPGETIAADGVVRDGSSAVDTAAMTGESVPATVEAGDAVTGGTVAVAGRLVVEAVRVGAATQLAQLIRLVERAQTDKARVQRLADRISAVFVPVVIGLAVLTGLGWGWAGAGPHRAISVGLAVLIIACPCALGLATPTALLAASGRGAQLGIFIKGLQVLEPARAIDTVVLDKTGTVTNGRMTVAEWWAADSADSDRVLGAAGAVENATGHLIGRAVAAYALRELGELPRVEEFGALPGLGARGRVDGRAVLIGSPRLMDRSGVPVPAQCPVAGTRWADRGGTTVLVAVDGVVCAALLLTDTVRSSAAGAVRALREMGLRTILLTGDNPASAGAVAAEIGVDETIAQVLPADKAAVVARLRGEGHVVAMVGDGINDAPALAGADLGMAVVTGTDVAIGAADVILVRDDLDVVPLAVALARRTLRTIRVNLAWAFGYNLLALPIAAAGLLNPLISSAAMALSSLLVVSNSLRLRGFGEPRDRPAAR